jgi:hypothetical protein
VPTVTITDNTSGDFTGVEDAKINDGNAVNYGSANDIEISGAEWRTVIRFTGLSNIPSNATVTAVTLRLNFTYAPDPGTVAIHRLLRNWVESEVTRDVYSTGNNWQIPNAKGDLDRVASASGSISCSSGTGWKEFSASGLIDDVQGWVDGNLTNNGWLLLCTTAIYFACHSSEASDGTRPELVVTYTVPGGSTIQSLLATITRNIPG